jgi:dimethylhistidine N-methyltransferase
MACRIIDRVASDPRAELEDMVAGLMAAPARLSPKYFYDELGCALYGAICRLPEYYPTRTETEIFRQHRAEIAEAMGQGRQFVDLGAGDCCKAMGWLPFVSPRRYLAVDIAAAEIHRALTGMARDFPDLDLVGVVTDFSRTLDLDDVLDGGATTFFYPGSSIGNFTPAEARVFLARIQAYCAERPGSGLLIGVDGKKAAPLLDAAYDDALGVTAAFNRNALVHLNRRFGTDFALDGFTHRGFYNAAQGRVEMHLEALREQSVTLPGGLTRRFAAGERIHSESSYKYHASEFEDLLRASGFGAVRRWSDPAAGYFVFYAS